MQDTILLGVVSSAFVRLPDVCCLLGLLPDSNIYYINICKSREKYLSPRSNLRCDSALRPIILPLDTPTLYTRTHTHIHTHIYISSSKRTFQLHASRLRNSSTTLHLAKCHRFSKRSIVPNTVHLHPSSNDEGEGGAAEASISREINRTISIVPTLRMSTSRRTFKRRLVLNSSPRISCEGLIGVEKEKGGMDGCSGEKEREREEGEGVGWV